MKLITTLSVLALITGCTSSQQSTANSDAKIAANAIAVACQYAPAILTVASSLAHGGASDTVAAATPIVAASCTFAGQAALFANDAAPVGPGNSGNSAAWLLTTAADALTVASGVPVVPAVAAPAAPTKSAS